LFGAFVVIKAGSAWQQILQSDQRLLLKQGLPICETDPWLLITGVVRKIAGGISDAPVQTGALLHVGRSCVGCFHGPP
jgi:hypothetical protein